MKSTKITMMTTTHKACGAGTCTGKDEADKNLELIMKR